MNFLIILVCLSLGALAKRFSWVGNKTSTRLNQFVIFICLPSIVLLKIPALTFEQSLLLPALLPWLMLSLTSIIVLVTGKVLRWSKPVVGCLLMVCCFGNTSFFGFPMVTAFWGEQALTYAVIYDILGSFLSLAIVGNIYLAVFSGSGSFDLKQIFKRLISFPPFIAIIVAFFLTESSIPVSIKTFLTYISYLLVPSTMFLVGMHLSLKIEDEFKKPLQFALMTKLIIAPLLVWAVFVSMTDVVTRESLIFKVSFFEAAMPPMVTASVMAIHARMAPQLAAACVGIGLFLSCFTLPLWYWLLS